MVPRRLVDLGADPDAGRAEPAATTGSAGAAGAAAAAALRRDLASRRKRNSSLRNAAFRRSPSAMSNRPTVPMAPMTSPEKKSFPVEVVM
jgi:hypothetical protein